VVVGGERSWEGCGSGGWAGVVVIRGDEDEDEGEGSPCGGEDGGLGSEPDASGVDGCVFSAAGGGGSSWIRGWVVGLVGGGEVVEGGEIRGLRVDNGGGEGGVTGGEEGPDAKRYQHAVLFRLCTKEQRALMCNVPRLKRTRRSEKVSIGRIIHKLVREASSMREILESLTLT